jgi:hypothetical protein
MTSQRFADAVLRISAYHSCCAYHSKIPGGDTCTANEKLPTRPVACAAGGRDACTRQGEGWGGHRGGAKSIVKGARFELAPPKRPRPQRGALDRSATLPFVRARGVVFAIITHGRGTRPSHQAENLLASCARRCVWRRSQSMYSAADTCERAEKTDKERQRRATVLDR